MEQALALSVGFGWSVENANETDVENEKMETSLTHLWKM